MAHAASAFRDVVVGMAQLHASREVLLVGGFDALCKRCPALGEMLVATFGDRHRAMHWMCMHHRCLGGQSGWEVLADGNETLLWDALERGAPW